MNHQGGGWNSNRRLSVLAFVAVLSLSSVCAATAFHHEREGLSPSLQEAAAAGGSSGRVVPEKAIVAPRIAQAKLRPYQRRKVSEESCASSICIEKTLISFDETNFRHGELLNIDNRSGVDQTVGVKLPKEGFLYHSIIRKPQQKKVPRDSWERFTLSPGNGVFVIMIPETDPRRLASLDGKEVVISVYGEKEPEEAFRVPIKVSADLKNRK